MEPDTRKIWTRPEVRVGVSKLIADTKTPEHKINVDVNDNVVTLRGTVDTVAQQNEAERLARETDGVKRVVNQLKVAKS